MREWENFVNRIVGKSTSRAYRQAMLHYESCGGVWPVTNESLRKYLLSLTGGSYRTARLRYHGIVGVVKQAGMLYDERNKEGLIKDHPTILAALEAVKASAPPPKSGPSVFPESEFWRLDAFSEEEFNRPVFAEEKVRFARDQLSNWICRRIYPQKASWLNWYELGRDRRVTGYVDPSRDDVVVFDDGSDSSFSDVEIERIRVWARSLEIWQRPNRGEPVFRPMRRPSERLNERSLTDECFRGSLRRLYVASGMSSDMAEMEARKYDLRSLERNIKAVEKPSPYTRKGRANEEEGMRNDERERALNLWHSGVGTDQIANMLRVHEYEIYNLLAKRFRPPFVLEAAE